MSHKVTHVRLFGGAVHYQHCKTFMFYANDLTIKIGPWMWLIMWGVVVKAKNSKRIDGTMRKLFSWNTYYQPGGYVKRHWSFHV